MEMLKCSVRGCERSAAHKDMGRLGFCSKHYQRYKKHNDPHYEWRQKRPALDWIEKHVTYTGDDCLQWPFATGEDGYGRVHDPSLGGAMMTASRYMCIIAHGRPESPELEAAHSCGGGNKGCVNPNHLYWATPKINHSDKVKHGTTNRGSRQWNSKLKEVDIVKIRELLAEANHTQLSIARMFSVDPSVISDIKRGKTWGWLS